MHPERRAFTLIELLVVIAVIAVLMAILMPVLQRAKEQAQEMTCWANLRQYGIAQAVYLDDFDGRYPHAWISLVKTEHPVSGYQRYCRWHDPRYPADGPFWGYLPEKKVHLCPTFNVLAKTEGGPASKPCCLKSDKAVLQLQHECLSGLEARRSTRFGHAGLGQARRCLQTERDHAPQE